MPTQHIELPLIHPQTPEKTIITSYPVDGTKKFPRLLLHKRLRGDNPSLLHNREIGRARRRAADAGPVQVLQRDQHGRRPLLVGRRALVAGVVVELDLLALHAARGDVLVQRGEEGRPGRRAGAGDVDDGVAGCVEAVARPLLPRVGVGVLGHAKVWDQAWVDVA